MKFIKKHPYLFWQFIGFMVLLIACVYLLTYSGKDFNIPFVVFMLMGAGFIIFLSPFVIYLNRRNKKNPLLAEINKYIADSYRQENGYKSEALIAALAVFLFLFTIGVMISIGLPFLVPLSIYLAGGPIVLHTKYVRTKFYKVKNGEEYCELNPVDDISFLESLYNTSVLTLISRPDPEFLNLLYNRLNNQGFLKDTILKIYMLTVEDTDGKYNIPIMGEGYFLLCIFSEGLNVPADFSRTFADDFAVFGGYWIEK